VLVEGFMLERPGHPVLIPDHYIQGLVKRQFSGGPIFFASVSGAFMYFATLTEVPILQGLIGAGMCKDRPFLYPICWLSVDATVEKVADIMMEIIKYGIFGTPAVVVWMKRSSPWARSQPFRRSRSGCKNRKVWAEKMVGKEEPVLKCGCVNVPCHTVWFVWS
jgi:hypothetical protein